MKRTINNANVTTFTRAFKRQFGMAPSEYRKQGKDA
jgi:AraC-like DNA-binding protein